jgi:hypothetical protein
VDSNFLGVGRVLAAHPTAANTVVSDCGSKSAYSNLSSYPDGAIRWNGKIVNGNTYEIDAINLCGTTDIFTFVATAVIPGTVTVVNENRTLTPNAATFSDSFAGYAAHVYQFTLVSSTADFSIGSSPGSPNSASINVGQSVTFNLQITPLGTFTGSVSLSCKISPSPTAAPTCTIPTSATVSSSAAVPFNVVVNTTSAASTELGLSRFPADPISLKWSLLFLASGFLIVSFKQSRRSLVPVLVILQAALWLGCGGSSSNTTSTAGGTPAGTYTATITATSSGLSHTATVTIVVQ